VGEAPLLVLDEVAAQGVATNPAQFADGLMRQVVAFEEEGFKLALQPGVRMLEPLAFEELDVLETEFQLKHDRQATNSI
jgi:hypothetical protein